MSSAHLIDVLRVMIQALLFADCSTRWLCLYVTEKCALTIVHERQVAGSVGSVTPAAPMGSAAPPLSPHASPTARASWHSPGAGGSFSAGETADDGLDAQSDVTVEESRANARLLNELMEGTAVLNEQRAIRDAIVVMNDVGTCTHAIPCGL